MRTLLNLLWLVLAGFWMFLGYVFAGAVMFITIIGIPFGVQSFQLAGYALWPFGRAVIRNPTRDLALSTAANVVWFILAGWWLALGHLLPGVLLFITIIGIPLGIASFKMAGLAVFPFGKTIVRAKDLRDGTQAVVVLNHDNAP